MPFLHPALQLKEVPQDTNQDPLIFILFVNNVSTSINCSSRNTLNFTYWSLEECELLQSDIDNVTKWRKNKLLELNESHRKRTCHVHFLDFTGERFKSSELCIVYTCTSNKDLLVADGLCMLSSCMIAC